MDNFGNNILDSVENQDVLLSLQSQELENLWWFYPISENNMHKVNVYAFYLFGAKIREAMSIPLKLALDSGASYPYIESKLEIVFANCLLFLKNTEGINLTKSREKAQEIVDFELRYWELVGEAVEKGDEQERQALFKRFLFRCNNLVEEFESILKHEIERINAFVIEDKGSFDIHKLIEKADEGFSLEVRKHLPDTAIYDFKEAGKCLVFDCPTAMAYHILRGIEAVVLTYLETVLGGAYTGKPGLGQYVQKLQKKSLNVPPRIIQRLDEIRVYDRNPIAHPDFIIKLDEAMPLYNLAQGIVPMMAKEMQKINPK